MSSEAPVHSSAFRRRRFFNWFPLGLTYAFLYMGRYNLTVSKNALGDLMTKEDFGVIFAVGTVVYGFAFLINGPITDKIGGKKAILISTFGSAIANLTMGLYLNSVIGTADAQPENLRYTFSFLYATNMYFQSFGAVSIVKVNSHWFHVRERGGFSGIFGTMISSGIFLAFTVNFWILDAVANAQNIAPMFAAKWVFYTPAMLLAVMFVFELIVLKDTPGETAHEDFDTGDASSGEEGQDIPPLVLIKRILTNPIILTIAAIEFCTGVLRNGIMHWYPIYAKEVLVLPSNHYMRNGSWDAWYLIAAYFVVGGITMYLGSRSEGRRKAIMIISGALIALLPFFQGGWGGILI
ncbi:MFS transporter, partial [Myxococcota bacterium]|nr:MFS transporter [Myxococcota bacterium]